MTVRPAMAGVSLKALEGIVVILCYAALAVWVFHPLFADPAHTILDPYRRWLDHRWLVPTPSTDWSQILLRDIHVTIWVLAWDWHALLSKAAWNLFHANIFHPAPAALAYWEHLLGHLPVTAPVFAISDNPVLAHQVNLLMSFALSGAAVYALLRHWGVERAAALLGGFTYAFCPVRLNTLFHSNLLALQYLPLSLLFLDRTLTSRRVSDAAAYALFLFVQVLCSYYLGYMALTALVGYVLGVAWARRGRLPLRGVLLVLAGSLVAAAGILLLSLPYLRVRAGGGLPEYPTTWPPFMAAWSNGLWKNYFYPPVALREWGYQLGRGRCVYLGIVPLVLAAFAFIRAGAGRAARWQLAMGATGIIVACYVMALGPELAVAGLRVPLPYAFAMELIPGFSSMRVPARYGLVLMLGLAILAGLGLHEVCRVLRSLRFPRSTVLASLVLLSSATAYEYDLGQQRHGVREVTLGARLPQVYEALSERPMGAVVEIPVGSESLTESEYMLHSTAHWYPLLNGTSAYVPPSYPLVVYLARALPRPAALRMLAQATAVRYVIVHQHRLTPEERELWQSPAALRLVGSFGDDLLYEIDDPPPPDLLPELVDCARDWRLCAGLRRAMLEIMQTQQ